MKTKRYNIDDAPARPRLPRCHFCGKYAGVVIYTDLAGKVADPTDPAAVISCVDCADKVFGSEAERARRQDKEVNAMH